MGESIKVATSPIRCTKEDYQDYRQSILCVFGSSDRNSLSSPNHAPFSWYHTTISVYFTELCADFSRILSTFVLPRRPGLM